MAVCVLDVDLLVRKLHQKLAKLQKDSTNVCASDGKDFDRGIIGEKLESMKKSKRGFLSNVTRRTRCFAAGCF